ncbi:hypothetical protein A2U01_0021188 [Trifolium medium]|uniref:Uncharacterized protein n=1 Tax=Trifolium medium TaxID=97028 RepID=A0A392NK08_9FABA|nr:hypothetical protein [Trifolium medium]
MSQLKLKSPREEESMIPNLSDQFETLTIKEENKALWIRRWGRHRKVAAKSKFGVKGPAKKTFKERLKIRFRKIIDNDSRLEKWINIPRKAAVEKTKRKSCVKGDRPKSWELCFAHFKEQQQLEYGTIEEEYDDKWDKCWEGCKATDMARIKNKPTYPLE